MDLTTFQALSTADKLAYLNAQQDLIQSFLESQASAQISVEKILADYSVQIQRLEDWIRLRLSQLGMPADTLENVIAEIKAKSPSDYP